jgi:hypothetical protein
MHDVRAVDYAGRLLVGYPTDSLCSAAGLGAERSSLFGQGQPQWNTTRTPLGIGGSIGRC